MKEQQNISLGAEKSSLEETYIRQQLGSFIRGEAKRITPPVEVDWKRLETIVFYHNVAAIFSSLMHKNDHVRNWLPHKMKILAANLHNVKTTVSLFAILEERKINAVGMRGIHLANFFYADPSLRPMHDVDILIRPEDRERLHVALEEAGHKPTEYLRSQLVYNINGVIFEIHWSSLTPKRYRDCLDSDILVSSRQARRTPEGTLYCLPLEQELIIVVTHAFIHHNLDTLLRITDIGLLMVRSQMDWQFIVDWSRGVKLSNLFCFALGFVNRFFQLGKESELSLFGDIQPVDVKDVYHVYEEYLWGRESLGGNLLMQRNQFYIAERFETKMRQLLRMFNPTNLASLYNFLVNKKNYRIGNVSR
jgi:putative nucleotidyltransferase-like protein